MLLNSPLLQERERGVAIVERLAALKNPVAMYALGTWRIHGANGFEVDEASGIELVSIAANSGVLPAICDYAFALEEGRGVLRNASLAFQYYILAAFLGDLDALHDAARCIDEGVGVPINKSVADQLFRLFEDRQSSKKKSENER